MIQGNGWKEFAKAFTRGTVKAGDIIDAGRTETVNYVGLPRTVIPLPYEVVSGIELLAYSVRIVHEGGSTLADSKVVGVNAEPFYSVEAKKALKGREWHTIKREEASKMY